MSHFIALRQRIKVIETIKKTTSAMRLISMSVHSRLRNQKTILEEYTAEITEQLKKAELYAPAPEALEEQDTQNKAPERPVIILIGSQKGLCGVFNEQLFRLFDQQKIAPQSIIITVGKYAYDHAIKAGLQSHTAYNQFNITNFAEIASALTQLLFKLPQTQATAFSNRPRTFFIQKPDILQLNLNKSSQELPATVQYLKKLQIKTIILQLLYESLLAEQAARFLSMDTAYRNADEVLNQTKLSYNKARQTAVTRELTELSAGMAALASED